MGPLPKSFQTRPKKDSQFSKKNSKSLLQCLNFESFFYFFSKFSLAWIVAWEYTILQHDFPYLGRSFKIKWWDQFNFENVLPQNLLKFFETHPTIQMADNPIFFFKNSKILLNCSRQNQDMITKKLILQTLQSLSNSDDEEKTHFA